MTKKKFVYDHPVYGVIEINEPVILELVNSAFFERLKHIDQAGYKPLFVKPNVDVSNFIHSRFCHSLGVYNLLKKYGAPIEEQIAGLLHDVSHTAFSHCVDYVFKQASGQKQDFQDNNHDSFIKKTEIPRILKKYSIDVEYVLNDENFPLKEKNLPDLCADRIDYSFQTGIVFGEVTKEYIGEFFNSLKVVNNDWVFNSFEAAHKYTQYFKKLNDIYYSALHSGAMFAIVGDFLRHALNKRYISENDVWKTDQEVIDQIAKNLKNDNRLNYLWKLLNGRIGYTNNPTNFDRKVFVKSRIVDPLYLDAGGEMKRISDGDKSWLETVEEDCRPKEYFIQYNLA